MKRLMLIFPTLLAIVVSCAGPTEHRVISHSSIESYFVPGTGPTTETFDKTLQNAISGNTASLTKILNWAQFTDGEGSLNYSMLLLDLQSAAGQLAFEQALAAMSLVDQKAIRGRIASAVAMRAFAKKARSS